MIYITGDTHADFRRFNTSNFPEQKEMTRDDVVLIAGDFGGIWYSKSSETSSRNRENCKKQKSENHNLDWFSEKNPTFCFVLGNHENYARYDSAEFPVVDFYGGKAQKIRDNVYHLMSGYVFDFDNKTFFTFDGASSHDITDGILCYPDSCEIDLSNDEYYDPEYLKGMRNKYYIRTEDELEFKNTKKHMLYDGKLFRIKDTEWWERECMPTRKETERGLKNLAAHDNKVDYVLTHCMPQSIAELISDGLYRPNPVTTYLESVKNTIQFEHWISGHYHENRNVTDKFTIIYEQIVRIL